MPRYEPKSKTSADGETWWGSNYGPEVDVVAPGVHIFTTDIMGTGGYSGGNYVPNFNGTSSATPLVAGIAALVLSANKTLRWHVVRDILRNTSEKIDKSKGRYTDGYSIRYGFGRVNADAAVAAAQRRKGAKKKR